MQAGTGFRQGAQVKPLTSGLEIDRLIMGARSFVRQATHAFYTAHPNARSRKHRTSSPHEV
ncbi:hypothetical protein EC915_103369 [Pseudomonas sp. LP_7_YM]|nr:hypothetical protein EC915_103369 [Pseudomonas sp. LP_7_YM]